MHLSTNPVVVRRALASLRKQGYVKSTKGHGGGWEATCNPEKVTLYDIYLAVGEPTVFALANPLGRQKCLIEQTIHVALARTLDEAKELLMHRFRKITLAAMLASFCNRRTYVEQAPK